MKKTILIALAIVAVIAAGIFVLQQKRGAAADEQAGFTPPAPEVVAIRIAPRTVHFTQELPGRITPYRVAEIRPQVSGIITKRLFEEGSEVKTGDQLYQIDPAPYEAAYESARANLMRAEANVRSVSAKAKRYEELVKIGGVSKQEHDDIRAGLQQARAEIAIAKAAVATAKIDLDYTKVFSPIDGRIGKSMVTEGALVTANQPQVLASVQQLDPVYVDVTQSSSEVMRLRRQMADKDGAARKTPVTLLLDGQSEPYGEQGALQFSDITVDQTTGNVQLRILFPNKHQELLPGLFVRARVEQARQDDAIVVPQQAVMRGADGNTLVWTIDDDGKAAPRPVQTAQAVGNEWVIAEGLSAGDVVILEGVMKVQPGAQVRAVFKDEPAADPVSGETDETDEAE